MEKKEYKRPTVMVMQIDAVSMCAGTLGTETEGPGGTIGGGPGYGGDGDGSDSDMNG